MFLLGRYRESVGTVLKVEIDGTVIRVGRDSDAETLATVIAALKAAM